ncbi:transposase [Endozoicomonas numazuensis]|uniref:transposase n=1 Tax=Endozoicomonas numazuensis TaxID=1137799 RepID=UPI0009DDFC25|nr:transposase [Endozoicomonas numazuensis]
MPKSTQKHLRFHPSNSKTVRADFNGGELSSDFGALLLRETMLHSGLIDRLTDAIHDNRHRWPKTHLLVRGDSHFAQPELMQVVQDDPHSDYVLGKGAGHKTALRPKAREQLDEARRALIVKTNLARANNLPEPDRLRLYGETEYQAKSWRGLDTRIIYKAEVNQKGDNPRFIVTSIKEASPEVIYEELYCPRGQDENFIKHLKSDLSGDRLSDQGFLANHLRMFYACAAYVLHHELRTKALKGTELDKAQPSTVIKKLCKVAVKVVEYKDRIKLHLPRSCPFKNLLRHVTEVFYRMPQPRPG